MDRKYDELMTYVEKMQALGMAQGLFGWDLETEAPREAAALTARMMGSLSSQYFDILTSPQVGELLCQAAEEELDEAQKAILRELAKERDRLCRIPAEEYREYAELTAEPPRFGPGPRKTMILPPLRRFSPVLQRCPQGLPATAKRRGRAPMMPCCGSMEEGFGRDVLDPFFAL